jgi:hypothetical protein
MIAALESGSVQQAVDSVRNAKFKTSASARTRSSAPTCIPTSRAKTRNRRPGMQGRPADPRYPAATTRGRHLLRGRLYDRAGHRRREKRRVQGIDRLAIGFSNNEGAPTVAALPPHRAAEEYEALRDASAAFAAKTGSAPVILQLNMGPIPQIPPPRRLDRRVLRSRRFRRRWRARFPHSTKLSPPSPGARPTIAVITSDDATYLETVAPLASAVKSRESGPHPARRRCPRRQRSRMARRRRR